MACTGASNTMVAVTSITNPVNTTEYIVFYNDVNSQLASSQDSKAKPSLQTYDYNTAADPQVPTGPLLNPSSVTAVLLNYAVSVYGVIQGKPAANQLICRLSPGFERLNIGESVPLAAQYAIAACSDSEGIGYLFYVVSDDGTPAIYSIQLPGTESTSQYVPFSISYNPNTYIGAVYGVLGEGNPSYFLAAQAQVKRDGRIHIFNGETEQEKPIVGGRAVENSPIAMLFHGKALVVYFFGPVGSGQQPDTSPVCRAVATDFNTGFNYTLLDGAPAPRAFTQLAAVSNPPQGGPGDNGLGSIILTYCQNASNQLLSWVDPMDGFTDPPQQ